MIYKKIYMDKILPFIDSPFVKILRVVRRCGKSTILQMIREKLLNNGIKKNLDLYYTFDSMEYENIKDVSDLFAELKIFSGRVKLIFCSTKFRNLTDGKKL